MQNDAAPIAVVFGLLVIVFGGRILLRVLRNAMARLHALRSIPLPRQPALVSGKPSGQIEAVFLDVFDTEHRRSFDGEPRYELYSAEEIAELRVTLFQRAFCRREPRILYEIEVGVPLLRKLEQRDATVCAWVEERLQAHPPMFGKRDTIDDLILKPPRFRRFLWTHGIGSSPVLFFEEIFKSLPITVLPRRFAATKATPLLPAPDGPGEKSTSASASPSSGPMNVPVASLEAGVMKQLETGDDAATRAAIAKARAAIPQGHADAAPVRSFLDRLRLFEERLDSFEDAFVTESSKHMDDWAPWLREALADASGGANLADLGENAVLDAFKRRARYRWVIDPTAVATAPVSSNNGEPGPASGAAATGDQPTSEPEEAAEDEPSSPPSPAANDSDKGSEIGF